MYYCFYFSFLNQKLILLKEQYMFKYDRRWIWIFLGVISIGLRILLSYFPHIIEQFYSRGIYVVIRYLIDYTVARLPIPLIYVLIISLLCSVFYRLFRNKNGARSFKSKAINFLFSFLAFIFGIIFLFLFLWGFNYARIPIEQQIGIQPKGLDKTELYNELLSATNDLITAYDQIKDFEDNYYHRYVFEKDLESKIRLEVKRTFKELGYPTPGKVRARYLYPKGTLLRISTAGFYFPFVGECHVDPGLHPLQIPYVMAHEFAHGFGIGDEGTCNFIAFLTCKNSNDPVMNYTGALSYWKSIAAQYRRFAPEEYKAFRAANIPQGIKDHIQKINIQMDKYPDLFPVVRDATYDAYLKTQGITEGMKNYSRVVLLVNAYRKLEKKI